MRKSACADVSVQEAEEAKPLRASASGRPGPTHNVRSARGRVGKGLRDVLAKTRGPTCKVPSLNGHLASGCQVLGGVDESAVTLQAVARESCPWQLPRQHTCDLVLGAVVLLIVNASAESALRRRSRGAASRSTCVVSEDLQASGETSSTCPHPVASEYLS